MAYLNGINVNKSIGHHTSTSVQSGNYSGFSNLETHQQHYNNNGMSKEKTDRKMQHDTLYRSNLKPEERESISKEIGSK